MQNIIFSKDDIVVSTVLFKTARRSFRISDIEKIAIKRPLLWFSLPIAIGSFALLSGYQPYLYIHERWLCMVGIFLLPLLGWYIATLNVTSKAYSNDVAAIGYMPTLSAARNALDMVIFQANYKTDTASNTDEQQEI
jgi:hypothetical protein